MNLKVEDIWDWDRPHRQGSRTKTWVDERTQWATIKKFQGENYLQLDNAAFLMQNRYNIIMLLKYVMENNICYHFLSAYYASFVMLDTWNKLSHLVLTSLIQNNPKFRDDRSRPEWLCDVTKDMQLLNGGAWIISQLSSVQPLCLF